MDIIQGLRKKELENLFSWNQFYKNSGMTVNRWPGKLLYIKYNENQKDFERYDVFDKVINNNRIMADKVQQEITNKFGANR